MKKDRKILYAIVVLALLISVIGISVGFASMSSSLDVNGVATMAPASWKIKFTNLAQKSINGSAEIIDAPQITSDTHIGNYSVKLSKPGDSIVYTFDVVNEGTIDSSLDMYTFNTPSMIGTGENAVNDASIVKKNLTYTLTYIDGSAINEGDLLLKGERASFKLTIAYNSDATELPQSSVNINGMDITFVYGQR